MGNVLQLWRGNGTPGDAQQQAVLTQPPFSAVRFHFWVVLCGARVRSRCSLWVRSNLRSAVISSSQRLLRHIPRALCCAEMCLLTRALWRVGLSPMGCSSMGDSSEGLQCSSLGTDCSGIRVGSGKVFWGWCTVVWFTFPSRAAAPSTANRGGEEGEELLSSWGGCGLSYCLPEEAAGGANCVSLR